MVRDGKVDAPWTNHPMAVQWAWIRGLLTSQTVTNFCHAQQGASSGSELRW